MNREVCGRSLNGVGVQRRDFLKTGGLTAAMLLAGRFKLMAGPFEGKDFDQVIPADKKLSKDWIASLYARGKALGASGDELKYIGMPISGLCTGQVYLGGDGRLWYWNLDATKDNKNNPKGHRYMEPDAAYSPFEQGFALQVDGNVYSLDADGFGDVRFTNQYPMGRVDYGDDDCSLKVQLEAYTPFIPLNRNESSYPVIVMNYTVTNSSSKTKEVKIGGWVENISHRKVADTVQGKKVSVYREFDNISTVECSADFENANSIALGVFGAKTPDFVDLESSTLGVQNVFEVGVRKKDGAVFESDLTEASFASIGRKLKLKRGESKTVSFAVSWRFPEIRYGVGFGMGPKATAPGRNHYATQWSTAAEAASQLASREGDLYGTTKQWVDTWYDSSLPYWFLERTFIPINCMQTQLGQRIYPEGSDQEHYNLEEGVRCCPGNCTHVWNYAQGLARIFPEIERECRDKVEFGLGFDKDSGTVFFRYTNQEGSKGIDAFDGTCGTIIRVLRESQMTTDYRFLASVWGRVKLAMDHVIEKWDPEGDGLLAGAQHNTLDEPWYGQVHWLTNVYHAALRASAVMARKMKQTELADRYERIVEKGVPAVVDLLWNEDFGYFIHKPPVDEEKMHGSTNGCHIDQVLGDSWLHEVGLDSILPQDKIRKSLQALWKYNFTPDVGAFRKVMTSGRYYAAEGDAGLVMCSFPHGKIEPKSGNKNYAGYLNECMTGFEWQVAAHMIREGMVEEGLAIGKAIYDRYQPASRNPYNEVECSDHYSRAMASYGAFLAVCGYRYDGPEGTLGFGPKLSPEDFKAGFTTAEGWGRFTQMVDGGELIAGLELRYGRLQLKEFTLEKVKGVVATKALVEVDGESVVASLGEDSNRYVVRFEGGIQLLEGQSMRVSLLS